VPSNASSSDTSTNHTTGDYTSSSNHGKQPSARA
jgi:hypothetical protein